MTKFHDLLGRIGPIAIIDLFGTILIVVLIGWWMDWTAFQVVEWCVIALLLGEVIHLILGIDTPVVGWAMGRGH